LTVGGVGKQGLGFVTWPGMVIRRGAFGEDQFGFGKCFVGFRDCTIPFAKLM
jgi:hypothetical protein